MHQEETHRLSEINAEYKEDIAQMTCDDIREMKFANADDAYNFYVKYALVKGFGVRKHNIGRNKQGQIIWKNFVCASEGKRPSLSLQKEGRCYEPRALTRFGCKASMRVHINEEMSQWYVRHFNDDHCHELIDNTHTRLLRGHRKFTSGDIALINSMRNAGIKIPAIMSYIALLMGGYDRVYFTMKDIYNQVLRERRNGPNDAMVAINYLQGLSDSDDLFFKRYTVDNNGRLENVFWCDGICRLDYECFGDVLAFDTTYRTNVYNKPLVVFSGVNHHRRTVVFGSALVGNEREETYIWLLTQFLEAMNGKCPTCVITDGDLSMKKAIKEVFPRSCHRLCAWHLLNNATANIADNNFTNTFRDLMLNEYEVEEFEEKWSIVVEKFGLQNNKWVEDLYAKRGSWANAHMKGKFFAGMRTTSRCEGLHSKIGKFINSGCRMTEFLHHFNRALSYFRNTEVEDNFRSSHGEVVLLTSMKNLERSGSMIYTREVFTEFRSELVKSTEIKVIKYDEHGEFKVYHVSKYRRPTLTWKVLFGDRGARVICSCGGFKFTAIPCSHMLKVFMYEDLEELPKSCIVKRWTKNAKMCDYNTLGSEVDSQRLCLYRFGMLLQTCKHICKIASETDESFKEMKAKLANLTLWAVNVCCKTDSERGNNCIGDTVYDPERVRSKGRTPNVRKVKGRRRQNSCGLCKQKGHSRRTCPTSKAKEINVNGMGNSSQNATQLTDAADLNANDSCFLESFRTSNTACNDMGAQHAASNCTTSLNGGFTNDNLVEGDCVEAFTGPTLESHV